MPFNLGFGEVLVVLVVALIVFGGRLPQVGNSLGRGLREFRKGLKGQGAPEKETPQAEPCEGEEVGPAVEVEPEDEAGATSPPPDPSP